MPSLWKILHNRSFQHPSSPLMPVDMECFRELLTTQEKEPKGTLWQSTLIQRANRVEVQPRDALSIAHSRWIHPAIIVKKATTPHSYIIDAQGKCYHRTREHTRPIHLNIPQPAIITPKPSHILKPHSQIKTLLQPQTPKHPIPTAPKTPSSHNHSLIPRPIHPSKPITPS